MKGYMGEVFYEYVVLVKTLFGRSDISEFG